LEAPPGEREVHVRAIKTTVSSILVIGLLTGSAVGVTAQDEEAAAEAPSGASYFTGTLDTAEGNVVVEPDESIVDGVLEVRGVVVEDEAIETSDPRINGTLSRALNVNVHKLSDFEDVVVEIAAWRIENEDGSWSGEGGALIHDGAEIPQEDATNHDTIMLTGDGAYEGLTAYVLADWTEEPVAVEGAVFVGEMPPPPDWPSAEGSEESE
jgi:hypothetical protein